MVLKNPPSSDPTRNNIATCLVKYDFDFSAAKFLRGAISRTPYDDAFTKLFVRNSGQPLVKRSIQKSILKEVHCET